MMRRYRAHWPEDLIAHCADGHGLVHLSLTAAAEIGIVWEEESRVGFVLPAPSQDAFGACPTSSESHFLRPGNSKLVLSWRTGRGTRMRSFWMSEDLFKLLTSSLLRARDKILLRSMPCGRVWNRSLLWKDRDEEVKCRMCGGRDGDGHLFWNWTFLPILHDREPPELSRWPRC